MARMQLGAKRVTPEAIEKWKAERGYDKPLLCNGDSAAWQRPPTRSSSRNRCGSSSSISALPRTSATSATRSARACGRAWRSRVPVFLVGLAVNITFALVMAFFRATYLDFWGVVLCVAMMSISTLFYIIGGQYLVSKLWHLVPISGYAGGVDAAKFLVLPVADRRDRRHRLGRPLVPHASSSRRWAGTMCAPRAPRAWRRRRCCSATC